MRAPTSPPEGQPPPSGWASRPGELRPAQAPRRWFGCSSFQLKEPNPRRPGDPRRATAQMPEEPALPPLPRTTQRVHSTYSSPRGAVRNTNTVAGKASWWAEIQDGNTWANDLFPGESPAGPSAGFCEGRARTRPDRASLVLWTSPCVATVTTCLGLGTSWSEVAEVT